MIAVLRGARKKPDDACRREKTVRQRLTGHKRLGFTGVEGTFGSIFWRLSQKVLLRPQPLGDPAPLTVVTSGGVSMGIYRVLYYSTVTVGSGGRITIPQEMRDELGLEDGDSLTARMEGSETGQKQLTIWKSKSD
jgi:AbrB family looped-hinge helix DNA binding protein